MFSFVFIFAIFFVRRRPCASSWDSEFRLGRPCSGRVETHTQARKIESGLGTVKFLGRFVLRTFVYAKARPQTAVIRNPNDRVPHFWHCCGRVCCNSRQSLCGTCRYRCLDFLMRPSKTFITPEETPIQCRKIPNIVWTFPGSLFGQSGNQARPWSDQTTGEAWLPKVVMSCF